MIKLLCLFAVISWVAPICSVDPDAAVTCEGEGSGVVRIDYESLGEDDLDCMASTNPHYADWVAWGKPDCWCYSRQCRGDIDGIKTGPFWISALDKAALRAAFNKTDIELADVPNGICADLDHLKFGPFRVQSLDKIIFRTFFNKPACLMPECDSTGYNFWITP